MNIGIVIDFIDGERNGVVVGTKRLVESLREHHHVMLFTTGQQAPNRVILEEFKLPLVGEKIKKNGILLAKPNKKLLQEAFQELDIIQIQMPYFLAFTTMRLAKKMGKMVIMMQHVQVENFFYQIGIQSRRFIDWFGKWYVKHLFNKADLVVCVSAFGERELRRLGLTVPSTVISNGIPDTVKKVTNVPKTRDVFTILSVGRMATEKEQHVLIEAIQRSRYRRTMQLVLVGDGPLRGSLTAAAQRLTYPATVGPVSFEDLLRYYSSADLYIHPSIIELEGISTLEAMTCGLPILVSDSPYSATQQFALDARSLFKASNPDDLAQKIDYWIEHPEELAASAQAYEIKARDFRLEHSLQRYEEVYQSLMQA